MSLNPRDKPDSSPCIGICSHATGDLVCRGCGRTLEEVRDWNTFTSERKIEIKEKIKNANKLVGAKEDEHKR